MVGSGEDRKWIGNGLRADWERAGSKLVTDRGGSKSRQEEDSKWIRIRFDLDEQFIDVSRLDKKGLDWKDISTGLEAD